MRSTLLLPVLLASLIPTAACHHQVGPVEARPRLRDEVGERATVRLIRSKIIDAEITEVQPGGVRLKNDRGAAFVPFTEIRSVDRVSHGRGAVEGLLLGLTGGLALAMAPGLLEGDGIVLDGYTALFAGSLGGAGGLAGLAMGASAGSLTSFTF
jgi:hypothetical protein